MQVSAGFKKYLFNTSWLLSERLSTTIVQIIVGVFVIRYLGPFQYGLLSYATSFVGLFVAIYGLGLDNVVVQMLVRDPAKENSILGTSIALKILASIVGMVIILAAMFLSNEESQSRLLITIITFSYVFQSLFVVEFYFTAQVASKFYVLARMAQNVVSSLMRISFVVVQAPLVWFAWMVVIDALILGVSGMFLYHKTSATKIRYWQFQSEYAKVMLKQSWPLALATAAITVYMRIDQIMIKQMLDATAVGYYAAAVRLSEGAYFVPMLITSSVFPAIIKAEAADKELYKDVLLSLYSVLTWLFIIIGVPVALLSHFIVRILFGENFAPAGSVLQIHIWGSYFVFLGVATGKWLLVENLQTLDLLRTVAGAVVNIGLNLLLIPAYGIQGAALSTLISYFFGSLLILFFFEKGRQNLVLVLKAFIPSLARISRFIHEKQVTT